MPVAPVAVQSPFRLCPSLLCPSLLCPSSMSASSFPSPEGRSPISLRTLLRESVCVSNLDERTVSACGGRGGVASERELCAISGRVKSLNRGHRLAVESPGKKFSGTYLTSRPGTEVAEVLGGPCCASCSSKVEPSWPWTSLLLPSSPPGS